MAKSLGTYDHVLAWLNHLQNLPLLNTARFSLHFLTEQELIYQIKAYLIFSFCRYVHRHVPYGQLLKLAEHESLYEQVNLAYWGTFSAMGFWGVLTLIMARQASGTLL